MEDELKGRLKELGLNDDHLGKLEAEGVKSSADMAKLSSKEIKDITGCGLVTAKNIAEAFTVVPAPATLEPQVASIDVLPSVPDDTSFIEMLKVGGILRAEKIDVISAMRAGIAAGVGLFDLPDAVLERMEQFAREQDEPVAESFYRLQKLVTQRGYGDILSAIGVPGNFVSERRKKEMLSRLNDLLWPALRGFHEQLVAWSDTWVKGTANPAMALTLLAMAQVGGAGAALPPGIMQPPDTANLRDAAEAFVNQVNKVFAGTGIPVARAMAYDAVRIREVLEEPTLPQAVGATTRDQMLKMLGVDVGADFVRLERNAIRYALSIMELPSVGSGTGEYTYLGAMLQLGAAIPWDKLISLRGSTIGRKGGKPESSGTFPGRSGGVEL